MMMMHDSTIIHDNRCYDNSDYNDDDDDDDDDDDTYGNYSEDDEYNYNYDDYKFDYNNPLDADDGTDDNDDDDDDDDSYSYCSSDDDDYYNHTPNVIFDMHGNQFTIDKNANMIPYDDKPMTLQAAQRQINAILAGCTTAGSIKEFTDQAKRKHDEFFLPNKNADRTLPATPSPVPTTYARNDHDAYLHHRWNMCNRKNTTTTSPSTTKPTSAPATPTYQKAYAPIEIIPVKDDQSITPTLETLSTLDTRSSDPTYNDTDAILNITIWNQPIVQYRMPIRPLAFRHRSREHPSTAVQYALIGVYDKLLNPSKLPCLLSFFTPIIRVVFSCFILLADFFPMFKIDDRYPDEWND